MKRILKRFSPILVCFLVLAQFLAVSASAAVVEWSLSEDDTVLTRGDRVYRLYDTAPFRLYPDSAKVYEFYQKLYFRVEGDYWNISAADVDTEIVWGVNSMIYATEAGTQALDAFVEGEVATYRLKDPYSRECAVLERSVYEGMSQAAATAAKRRVDVSELKRVERHDLVAYEATDAIAYVSGAIYVLDDTLYYLDYRTLGNQYFDADGNFSYRKGSVELTPLDDGLTEAIEDTVRDYAVRSTVYTHEQSSGEPEYPVYGSDSSVAGFWVCLVFLGFLAPIPFLVIGLVLPHSQKRGYPKYWYALAGLAALWMLFALLLAILVLL